MLGTHKANWQKFLQGIPRGVTEQVLGHSSAAFPRWLIGKLYEQSMNSNTNQNLYGWQHEKRGITHNATTPAKSALSWEEGLQIRSSV